MEKLAEQLIDAIDDAIIASDSFAKLGVLSTERVDDDLQVEVQLPDGRRATFWVSASLGRINPRGAGDPPPLTPGGAKGANPSPVG